MFVIRYCYFTLVQESDTRKQVSHDFRTTKTVRHRANTSRNLLKIIVNRQNPICGTHREKESVGSDRADRDDRRQKS